MYNSVNTRTFIALCFSAFFVLLCNYWVENIEIYNDTLQYYYYYLNIKNEPFPLPLEYFSFGLMYFCDYLGFNFKGYLLVNYYLWIPLIYLVFFNSNKNILFFFIGLFFFTHLFMVNVPFLIRQYNGFLFFLYFILTKNRYLKYIFGVTSIFSHLSSLFYFFVFNEKVSGFIVKNKIFIFVLSVSLFLTNISSDIIQIITEFNMFSDSASVSRKFQGVTDYYYEKGRIRYEFVLLNIFICLLFCFFINMEKINNFEKRLYSLIFVSSTLYISFASQPMVSNRIGFIGFAFVIPSLLLILRGLNVRFKF